MTPSTTPWTQLMKEVRKIAKEPEAEACRGLHPKVRNIGMRKAPPPRPNPLKTPALKLFLTSVTAFTSIGFSCSVRSSSVAGACMCFMI